ncbi:hypothetical protein KDK77_00635 [bacterium]|nr:hypothetical protein [bacterium]MCP5462745.1 hypothetical protein [bacterium]
MQRVIIVFIFLFLIQIHCVFSAHFSDKQPNHAVLHTLYKTPCTFYYDSSHSEPNTIAYGTGSYHDVLQSGNDLSDHHAALAEKTLLKKTEIQESRKFGLTFCTSLGFICISFMMLHRNKIHDREIF